MKALPTPTLTATLIVLSFLLSSLVTLPTAATAQTAAGGDNEITRPEKILDLIPADILKKLKVGDPGQEAAIKAANDKVQPFIKGKSGTFSFTIRRIDIEGSSCEITARPDPIRVSGQEIWLYLLAHFDAPLTDKIKRLKSGDRVKVTGTLAGRIYAVNNQRTDVGAGLRLDLQKATLK